MRVDFGIGNGYRYNEFAGFCVPMEGADARFDECLEVILKAFTQDRFDNDGQFYQYRGVSIAPRPLQQPYPPVFVAAQNADSVRWCAERGLPVAQQYLEREATTKSVQMYCRLDASAF